MKKLLTILSLITSIALAQDVTLQTFFNNDDLRALESLISAAERNDLTVLELSQQLESAEYNLSTEGRLTEALNVRAGGSFDTDLYQQAAPSFNISLSLDVMQLVKADDDRGVILAKIAEAKDAARVKAVEAFVAYKVAVEGAEAAARNVEAAQAAFEVTKVRVETGDAIVSSQIRAQSDVADAAIALLTANGNVIVALERLAEATGLSPQETVAVIGGDIVAGQ